MTATHPDQEYHETHSSGPAFLVAQYMQAFSHIVTRYSEGPDRRSCGLAPHKTAFAPNSSRVGG